MDPNSIARIKSVATTAVIVVVVGFGAYQYAAAKHAPKMTEVATVSCGALTPTNVSLPLDMLQATASKAAFALGPVNLPNGGGAIRLHFDAAADGSAKEVRQHADTVHLPLAFGRNKVLPNKITLTCRDGGLASVRYSTGNQGGQTYSVSRTAIDTEPSS